MLWRAIKNGLIDTIGTDHVANKLNTKVVDHDLWKSLAGFPGLATMLPVMLSEGVNKNRITLERVAEVCSYNTARIFGMYPKKGTLSVGSDADIVVWNPNQDYTLSVKNTHMRTDYIVYEGMEVTGKPVQVYQRGNKLVDGEQWLGTNGSGHFVHREPHAPVL